jgi:uncharacterized protein CbrC (UPF0167 family)
MNIRFFIERLIGRRIFKFDPKPFFRFHPECYENGTFKQMTNKCITCGQASGWLYDGSIYSICNDKPVCATCIAEGRLKSRFGNDYQLHDIDFSSDPEHSGTEILQRTPGFSVFNPIVWPVHNTVPMAYIGVGEEPRFWDDPACREYMKKFWDEEIGGDLDGPTPYLLVFKSLDDSTFGFAIDLD